MPTIVWIFKFCLIIIMFIIFWQDFKHRLVYWFLYLGVAILGFSIQFNEIELTFLILSVGVNLLMIGVIILVLFLYAHFYLKKKLINEAIGVGDVFMFLAMAFSFSIENFIYIFSVGQFFSLILHFLLSKISKQERTIPLAGYLALCMALFFILDLYKTSGYEL
jgi:hypothetical protein